jgi:Skp family chaperone for outer membrane proteins
MEEKMKNKLRIIFLTVIFSLCGIAQVFAAAIGVVNIGKLQQQHKDFARVQGAYEQLIINYRNEFNDKYTKKTLAERKAKVAYYNSQLDKERRSMFRKINKDIKNSLEIVAKEKNLAGVVISGTILEGQVVDITDEVCSKIQKLQ